MLRKGKVLKIELWGVRGSLPTPRSPDEEYSRVESLLKRAVKSGVKTPQAIRQFLQMQPQWEVYGFGGHTSCVELSSPTSNVIIDCGSGLRRFGERALSHRTQKEFHILMTHFHWDHLVGLPFFTPVFMPGYTLHFYAVQPDLEAAIRLQFQKPYFPVPFEELQSRIQFHRIPLHKQTMFGDLGVTPYLLDHPDPCYGYRVECGGRVYSHVVDTETIRLSREELGADLPLYQNVDVMLFDAQYTLKEAAEKVHWGHSSAAIGLDLALRENIKQILFVHHDPASNDEKIKLAEKEAFDAFEDSKRLLKAEGQKTAKVIWQFAREGLVVEI